MSQPAYQIRVAVRDQYTAIGALTARAYVDGGLMPADSTYLRELTDVSGRADEAEVLVAVTPGGRPLGSVAFVLPGSALAQLAGEREAEFRMLAVDPDARRFGVGRALVNACAERAKAVGATTLRLLTGVDMVAAHSLYGTMGFVRTPERDTEPGPGIMLLAYALDLGAVYCDWCGEPDSAERHHECRMRRALEPPRWCPYCRRRLTIVDLAPGWAARCDRHGTLAPEAPR